MKPVANNNMLATLTMGALLTLLVVTANARSPHSLPAFGNIRPTLAALPPATFDGEVALVTGGATGIGLATTIQLYQACATVVMASRNATHGDLAMAEISKLPKPDCKTSNKVVWHRVDIRNRSEIVSLIDFVDSSFGKLTVMVNNAGISGVQAALSDIPDKWVMGEHDAIMTNLYGTFQSVQEELRYLDRKGIHDAAIVNVASVLGQQGCADGSMYDMAKHGIIGLTKSAALERSAATNTSVRVRINAVAPGAIDTAMLRNSLVRPPQGLQNWQCYVDGKVSDGPCPDIAEDDPAWKKLVKEIDPSVNPIQRIARPEEVAAVITFLASPSASFVQGTIFNVDGGLYANMG